MQSRWPDLKWGPRERYCDDQSAGCHANTSLALKLCLALSAGVSQEGPRRPSLSGAERAELALIEGCLTRLRRDHVVAERVGPSKMIEESLGPVPRTRSRRRTGTPGLT